MPTLKRENLVNLEIKQSLIIHIQEYIDLFLVEENAEEPIPFAPDGRSSISERRTKLVRILFISNACTSGFLNLSRPLERIVQPCNCSAVSD